MNIFILLPRDYLKKPWFILLNQLLRLVLYHGLRVYTLWWNIIPYEPQTTVTVCAVGEVFEADNQWFNYGLGPGPENSSPTPWAAEQYKSAKPNVSQRCGGRQTRHRTTRQSDRDWLSVRWWTLFLFTSCGLTATESRQTIPPLKLDMQRGNMDCITSCCIIRLRVLAILQWISEHPNKVCVNGLIMDCGRKAKMLSGGLKDLKSNISSLLLWIQIHADINLGDILTITSHNERIQT